MPACVEGREYLSMVALSAVTITELYTTMLVNVNNNMAQRPLFVLAQVGFGWDRKQVYEGESFCVGCSDEVFTAHTVRGVPVVRSSGGSLQMLVKDGYFKVAPAPGRAEVEPRYASAVVVYIVTDVSEATGIAEISCDEVGFLQLSLRARNDLCDRYDAAKQRNRNMLLESLADLRRSFNAHASFRPSKFVPAAMQILSFAYRHETAVLDCKRSLSRLAGLYPRLLKEYERYGKAKVRHWEAHWVAEQANAYWNAWRFLDEARLEVEKIEGELNRIRPQEV